MPKITTFLMFDGQAEQAMNLYISSFADSAINGLTFAPAMSLHVTCATESENAHIHRVV